MANLTAGIQRIGTYIGSSPFVCTGSVFAVGTTRVATLNTSGNPLIWRNGSNFNNFPGAGKDQIPPGTAIIILPSSGINVDDSLFSFGTPINTNAGNAFSSGFGA